MAINDQMEMAFSGPAPRVDPVSGNEVPPGSLPVEVRDDIDVNLSEGEYIVPSDVLRFHGVKFFEDLRAEAKMGLAGMDAAGRIGGQPSGDAPMDPAAMGISEEDIAMLEQALGGEGVPEAAMAEGGLMDKVAFAAMNDPLVNERINSKGMAVGLAEGGMTQSLYSDPTRIDSLIDKVMNAAQNNPALLGELSKRGVTVNTTKANMKPAEMQQANRQPVELAHGGSVHKGPSSGQIPEVIPQTPLGFSGDMGTAPTVPTKAEGGTGFNPFQYGLGFSSFGLTNPAGTVPSPVAPAVVDPKLITGIGSKGPAKTGRNSVAVGESYTKPNGETKTRMPDSFYAGGGDSDQNRRNKEFFDNVGNNEDLKKYSYGDPEKLFSETMADATGKNNPIESLLQAVGKGSIFAASENVSLNDRIARLKRDGFDEDKIADLQKKVDAKKLAELGAKPSFLARGILSIGASMAASQAKRIDDLFPIADNVSSSSSASSTAADTTGGGSIDSGKVADKNREAAAKKAAAKKATAAAVASVAANPNTTSEVGYDYIPQAVTNNANKPNADPVKEEQTKAGQKAGKGYVGGYGFQKGGLMQKKKK